MNTLQDKILAKDKIVSDLSEQLKESEERIQDLLLESEGSRRVSKEKEREHEENLGRIIMAIEDEYKDTIKMQQEQVRLLPSCLDQSPNQPLCLCAEITTRDGFSVVV